MQQRPTCSNVRIRSTRDAHKIFYAVQNRLLPMITRRLDADERLALGSGCVYAWEERGPHTEITGLGIERFTEGRRWSPSRVRDEFLFYYEKYTPPADAGQTGSSDKQQPPRDWDPLVKQTYSVWVETEKGRRKWHLTAYFTQATVDQLGTIDDIPTVADLVVPNGAFQSTRVSKNRKGDDSRARPSDVLKTPSSVTRTYAPFPAAYPAQSASFTDGSPPTYSHVSNSYRTSSTHSTHSPSFHHSTAEVPQFSLPPPLPPSGNLHSLPPLRSSYEDVDYKTRRPSLPPLSQQERHPKINDRRPSMDYAGSGNTHSGFGLFQDVHSKHSYPSPSSSYTSRLHSTNSYSAPVNSVNVDVNDRRPDGSNSSRPTVSCSYNDRSYSPPPLPSVVRPSSAANAFNHESLQPSESGRTSSPYLYSPYSQPSNSPSPHGLSHISLPPPAQLLRSEPPAQLYEVASSPHPSNGDSSGIGPCRVDLAPLYALQRSHPYRRDPLDDKALRMLRPPSA
ncbi:Gti1/Pac2 family-domain-containing protein [Hygrophoropsis aurantiaca]|uniref:Gti1/Pac2 family-domain-containing protein n=1 Tax=Hygrophoropsis aurantiaca TaxID=72124 RepID=A0ACB8A738_9AGAM|nr:Gti1/Pac2 family-domain-containing protein [Hygrophoropsis aurantiaca]